VRWFQGNKEILFYVFYKCIGASDNIFDQFFFRSSAPTSPAKVNQYSLIVTEEAVGATASFPLTV
jgi:hypothetical protein